jgi:hypothetical protein
MQIKKRIPISVMVGSALTSLTIYSILEHKRVLDKTSVQWQIWEDPPPYSTVPLKLKYYPLPHHNFSDKIAFVIMASSVNRNLHLCQRKTFLRQAKHTWAFSDTSDGIFTLTLPTLEGKRSWENAQHRQLRGMQWLITQENNKLAKIEWIFMIDDDTWVNMPVLHAFLNFILWPPPRDNQTFMCGYYYKNGAFNGGGGILLNRALFDYVVPRLYSESCPFLGVNDATITECARKANATFMHSGQFSFYPHGIESANDFIEQVTMHPVKDCDLMQAMTRTSERFFKSKTVI